MGKHEVLTLINSKDRPNGKTVTRPIRNRIEPVLRGRQGGANRNQRRRRG